MLLLVHLPCERAEDLQRVLAGQPPDADDQQYRPKPQPLAAAKAHAAATATFATGIDHIVAAPAFSPFHEVLSRA
jgi:hypothetical protein